MYRKMVSDQLLFLTLHIHVHVRKTVIAYYSGVKP